ncbi:MAG: hypothetical protein Q9212_000243 [Teloschistes hypoglaucus]
MLCAISGEAPQVPVASRKSGNVFEKRLVEAYIGENGKDPVTDEELSTDDLVELQTAKIVRPRPPTLTSIPSLLSVFQNEWDALALETYTLRQQLTRTRQELSTALYQNDAAIRVIARLSRERDEAREALSRVSAHGISKASGDPMQVDTLGLSSSLITKVEATQEKLSKTRRKRPIPDGWVSSDALNTFTPVDKSESLYAAARSFALNTQSDSVLIGGCDGTVGVFSVREKTIVQEMNAGPGMVTDVMWAGSRAIASTTAGNVKVFENGLEVASLSCHAGEVTAIALHPSGDILASTGVDKSYIFYDLTTNKMATQVFTDAELTTAAFHPDGHLFAAGGVDAQIKVYDVKSATNAANFESNGPIRAISFSENGTWLASAAKNSTSVSIWDLRKAAVVHALDIASPISALCWDYTGQFLAIAGPSGLIVQHYSKSTKEWSEPLKNAYCPPSDISKVAAVYLLWSLIHIWLCHDCPKALLIHGGKILKTMDASSSISALFDTTVRGLKRTRDRFSNGHLDPTQAPQQPQTSNQYFPTLSRLTMPALPTLRFAGDGLDFRRPVSTPASQDIIDLTGDASPTNVRPQPPTNIQVNSSMTTLRNPIHNPSHELIDIDEESTRPTFNAPRLSPEIELVEVRTIHSRPINGTEPARRQRVRTERPQSTLRPFDHTRHHERDGPFAIGAWGALRQHARGQERAHGLNQQPAHHSHYHLLSEHIMPPDLIPRAQEYHLPGDLDFVSQGFQLGNVVGVRQAQPPLPTYDKPSPARPGHTRSPKEDDVLVCPNCEEELGTGDNEDKRQVWAIKACGHVRRAVLLNYRHPTRAHLFI